MPGHLIAVNVLAELRPQHFRPYEHTAIDKRPVDGPVEVGPLGLAGDRQCDLEAHGGPYQALYAYADEDAAWWGEQLGRDVVPGLFGENLRTRGIDVTGAEIGEQWRIGAGDDAVIAEVTAPRIPCRTFQHFLDEPQWVRRFTERGWPGAYLRVVRTGSVRAGDPVEVISRPGHGITIGDTFLRADPAVMARLLDVADRTGLDLSPSLREAASRAAARA